MKGERVVILASDSDTVQSGNLMNSLNKLFLHQNKKKIKQQRKHYLM